MRSHRFSVLLIALMCLAFTGCEFNDSVDYFFSSDAGLLFFTFGDPVCAKPVDSSGPTTTTPTASSHQEPGTITPSADATTDTSGTNTLRRISYVFDLFVPTPAQDSTTSLPSLSTPETPVTKEAK